jgi:ribosomal protein S18 acetylase RimI-like enzyme
MAERPGIFVRTAGEKDLEAVRTLLVETWHDTYDAIYGADKVAEITGERHSLASLRARLTRPHSEFLVADDGLAIAGMAFAVAIDEGATIMLHQLYVRPDKQRAGTGELLLDEIEASFPEARRVVLEVEAANAKGVAFYRKHGFVEAGTSTRTGIPAAGAGTAHRLYEKLL